ncbi:hypothetical protein AGABI1DRAFT_113389 [Agaricus bisporus var. burnettii JB137-S8]|uniref:Rho GDP-dissociation inhibitor n=1 Tax=Agaricus bisporus var. burnettii (strain JB137-S8 / ATCC MYA-4627 / FGSC 10392) TaxID=597362 RepID=K5XAW1_AGABU|nr:uncharacterized protein AGABI1DRAFT_113389 [Agaricus bisporus var. burnettii JB137-S8]EKM80187.1 hypothetical protein AGABI1DRAFT_113389 [Agaricus bisporus var. burnettii JB137-S8]
MSNPPPDDVEAELKPTATPGYNPGGSKSPEELAALDQEDESLARWKASLGIVPGTSATPAGPKLHVLTLELASSTLPSGKTISMDINNPQEMAAIKKNPIVIKEGVEYNVRMNFRVSGSIIPGVRYIQLVKRSGIKVDKFEKMLGSYGPRDEQYTVDFEPDDSPSGIIARTGTYNVVSRVVDDDGEIHANWEWQFKIGKEWA